MKSFFQENEGKSVVAERFIKTLKNETYKYMNSVSKNVYIYKVDDKVNKYNNTYHSIINMKPVDVKSSTYFDSSKENNNNDPNLKLVILLEYQNTKTFQGYVPNWSTEVFAIKKVKNTVSWTCC